MKVLERYEPLVDDPEAFYAACQRRLPVTVRANPIKASLDRVQRALDEEDVGWEACDWNPRVMTVDTEYPGNTWANFHGWVHGQEEVSALPPVVVDPQPGERVWDACAAPGGKTTQLAALMDDEGLVVANDNNLGRLSALRSNAERLGVTNVAVTNRDARRFSLSPFGDEPFDRALVDAPCSCEGTVRKNPEVLDEWSEEHVRHVAGLQKGILRRAIQATRKGGTVVYSTCTFAPEENEAVLDHVLKKEECQIRPIDVDLETCPGITEWDGEEYDSQVEDAVRIYPHHNDTGGFFCAKLEVSG